MSNLSTTALDDALSFFTSGTTYYLGLGTAAPGSTGESTTSLSFQAITFGAPSAGSQTSTDSQSFASVPGSVTYADFSVWTGESTTLTTALTSGTAYTTLAVDALPASLASGASVTLVSGTDTQVFTTSASVASGATSIPVNSADANFSYPVGTTVVEGTYIAGGALTSSITPSSGSTIDVAAGGITYTAS
jgi:hypothetical protein